MPAKPANHNNYPAWVGVHVPHDSTDVPPTVRRQFPLDDQQLADELVKMTDHHTQALFVGPRSDAVDIRAPVSRLDVDVERFPDDESEPMATRGMGAVYAVTSELQPLRRALGGDEREALIQAYPALYCSSRLI